MKIPVAHSLTRGQTSLEYLLLLAVVAVVVIASFGPGSLISKVHDSAQDYFSSVTRVIMGENPKPINGAWCPITCPSGSGPTTIFAACECPAPAFGGAPCLGSGQVNCS
jgi:Flp pilus assembly pilin Flp